jgi:hemerythrin-like domain-containing protein
VKRHPALEQLSRDHHQALVVAQRLKRADDASATAARAEFLTYWQQHGREHFREEEEVLLPACAGFMDADHPLIARVLTDHVRIRHLADRLGSTANPPLQALHELGERLERHVRLEERELFPLIERSASEDDLRRLVTDMSR